MFTQRRMPKDNKGCNSPLDKWSSGQYKPAAFKVIHLTNQSHTDVAGLCLYTISKHIVGASFPWRWPTVAKIYSWGWQLHHGTCWAYGAPAPFCSRRQIQSPKALGCLLLGFCITLLVCLSGRTILLGSTAKITSLHGAVQEPLSKI